MLLHCCYVAICDILMQKQTLLHCFACQKDACQIITQSRFTFVLTNTLKNKNGHSFVFFIFCYSVCFLTLLKSCSFLCIAHFDLYCSFEPPGSLSTGMSCEMQAVFQPKVSTTTSSLRDLQLTHKVSVMNINGHHRVKYIDLLIAFMNHARQQHAETTDFSIKLIHSQSSSSACCLSSFVLESNCCSFYITSNIYSGLNVQVSTFL